MNKIVLDKVSKKYNKEWVFKNISYTFESNNSYVIKGANGSGKSTLLQIIASFLSPSKGSVSFFENTESVPPEKIYSKISFCSPYMELLEEFTLSEILDFHLEFKHFYKNISKDDFIKICFLENSKNKIIKNFSSGMKQRLKLGLAILSVSDAVFLDEPLSNLDSEGILFYKNLIEKYLDNRIVIVCSNNIENEFFFCKNEIEISNFK